MNGGKRSSKFPGHEMRTMISGFRRDPKGVGTIAPSSEWLSEAAADGIGRQRVQVIVEFGPGTGAITKKILDNAHPDSRILAIERDHRLYEYLQSKFGEDANTKMKVSNVEGKTANIKIIEGDCLQLEEILRGVEGFEKPDIIVSGIPLLNLPKHVRRDFLTSIARVLHPEGIFNQITISVLPFKRMLQPYFGEVEFKHVWRNLPPGGVYYCRKPIVA